MPTSWRPSRSSRIPGIVSASTRFPARARAATAPVVCSSPSSRSMPIVRRCSTTCARERVVVFVTKRIRWPRSRRRRTAAAAPAIGSPETCSTPSTSRRIAAMDVESIRSEVAFRFSRSSGPGGQHAQKSSTRVEALFDVEASAALTDAERRRVLDQARPGRPVDRAGRAVTAAQSRARDRPHRRAAAGGDEGAAAAAPDEADEGIRRAAPRREEAPRSDEAPPALDRRLTLDAARAGGRDGRSASRRRSGRRARGDAKKARMMAIAVMSPQCLRRDYQHKWM